MNSVARHLSSLFGTSGYTTQPFKIRHHQMQQLQQCRGIRVRVVDGNLEMALGLMQRKMQGSGIERMIKQEQRFHIKNSEKRVLAKKNLERRLRSEDFAKKLKTILVKKVRGL
ncbi:Ribosomal protein S21 [Vigna unguiculata]|uniref:Ribosomal protein S21 n=1 Tax=Vigna unguiculata TaxID=3917 RepID=A0A4D6NEV7_VIGUN|nr:Ribosomal protein S21 [Vigna unguiculata]